MIDLDAAMTYLEFVEERHRVWQARQAGLPAPWTKDPILASYKFTNVYRVLDPGSQYLFRGMLEGHPRDALMRCFLYRHTGRTEVWDYLHTMMDGWPVVGELDEVLELLRAYRGDAHVRTRTADPRNAGRKTQTDFKRSVFTGAYLVFPQSATKGTDKLESIIRLTQRLFLPRYSDDDVVPDFLAAKTQAERFAVLRRNKGVADFMSMQVLTDWGYSDHAGEDLEDEFVVLGPGARRGAQAIDPTAKPDVTFRWAVEAVRSSPTCPELFGRVPSHMDIQNTLCEFSKYVRFQSKPPREPYQPAHPGPQPPPVLPSHWA